MEMIYSNGILLRERNFPKIIADCFTQGLAPPEFKEMNLRLSSLYTKWYNFTFPIYALAQKANWDNFFQQNGQYYVDNWNKNIPDYLLSLLFNITAYDYSKKFSDTINDSARYLLKNGIPDEIEIRSDAHRTLIRRLKYMSRNKYLDDLYLKILVSYFRKIKGIDMMEIREKSRRKRVKGLFLKCIIENK